MITYVTGSESDPPNHAANLTTRSCPVPHARPLSRALDLDARPCGFSAHEGAAIAVCSVDSIDGRRDEGAEREVTDWMGG